MNTFTPDTMARLVPFHSPKNLVALVPEDPGDAQGTDWLEHSSERVLNFIQENRWAYPLCMLAEANCTFLQPGTIVLATSGAAIVSYLLRWYALKLSTVWVDTFDRMPALQRAARGQAIERLEATLQRPYAAIQPFEATSIRTAINALSTGYWDIENLPWIGALTWPSGEAFALNNPALPKELIEESYREGLFEMIDRGLPFQGEAGSIPANVLFGVRVLPPEALISEIRQRECAPDRSAPCLAVAT